MLDRRTLLISGAVSANQMLWEQPTMVDETPPTYFVLFHTPGPHWDEGKPFDEQPGIMDHVKYMGGFFAKGELVMGGPFLDNSGGMMVFAIATIEQARAIASDDPAVKAGLLTVNVKPWLAAFHR
jgi:uncharacterized protein YciI